MENAESLASSASPRRSLWRHRNFMLLWTGQTVSQVGSAVTTIAFPLTAITVLKASTFEVGVLMSMTYCAFSLLSLPAGVLADHFPRRAIMVWSDLARFIIIGSVPLAALQGLLTLMQLYIVAFAAGLFSVFFDVAYYSYVPTLIDESQLVNANGRLGASQSIGLLGGRSLGSALIAIIGAAGAIAVDAFSYVMSMTCLLMIHDDLRKRTIRNRTIRDLLANMVWGVRFVTRHPILKRMVACAALGNFFIAMETALTMLFLVRTLQVQAAVAGLLISIASVGGLLGSLMTDRLTRWIGSGRIVWFSILVFGLPQLVLPYAQAGWGLAVFIGGYGASGFSNSVFGVAQLTYRQTICSPESQGRMNAACRWLSWGPLPLGGLVGGLVGSALGIRISLGIAVAGIWASGFIVFFSPLRKSKDFGVISTSNG